MIVTLAGRRIDALHAKMKRFPAELAGSVKKKLIDSLLSVRATHLVCSGACGSDLLALQAAEELLIQRTLVLPFDPDTFRSTSVEDLPGDWGMIYDKIIGDLKDSEQLIVLHYDNNDSNAYKKTNMQILDHAEKLANKTNSHYPSRNQVFVEKLALIVWEGSPKEANDTTYHFMQEAQRRNFIIREIKIIE